MEQWQLNLDRVIAQRRLRQHSEFAAIDQCRGSCTVDGSFAEGGLELSNIRNPRTSRHTVMREAEQHNPFRSGRGKVAISRSSDRAGVDEARMRNDERGGIRRDAPAGASLGFREQLIEQCAQLRGVVRVPGTAVR